MEAVTAAGELTRHLRLLPLAVLIATTLAACDLPFGLGLASTRALEAGARASLSEPQFEMSGTYFDTATWAIDVQLQRPWREHVLVSGATLKLEAIVVDLHAYFRGRDFLASHMSADPLSQSLVRAAGNAWWKGLAGLVPPMTELTQPDAFQRTFLGPAVSDRTDHVDVDGVDAAELSGPRADVYIALAPPFRLLRIRLRGGATVDGMKSADLRYRSFGTDFKIAPPTDVIDFSNLSTLPPIYQVESVDTSGCANPCAVTAVLKNLGGLNGASAPSTITFTLTPAGSNTVIGSCQAKVVPDVAYNDTTMVGCTIANISEAVNAAIVTATVDNPGRG